MRSVDVVLKPSELGRVGAQEGVLWVESSLQLHNDQGGLSDDKDLNWLGIADLESRGQL